VRLILTGESGHVNQGSAQVVRVAALLELDGGGGRVLGRVGDGVRLASLEARGQSLEVERDGHGRGNEGSARENNLEELHVDVWWWWGKLRRLIKELYRYV
jgi:hypothetical protein